MQADPILRCDHLVRFYDTASGRVQAVRGIDLELEPGVTTAVIGPSGSGKSSLLRMLGGLDRPTAGTVLLDGIDLWRASGRDRRRLRSHVLSSVAQRPTDNLFDHLNAEQQLRRVVPIGPNVDSVIGEWLELLGLAHRRTHRPGEMSGGERQRLAFARAAVAGHRLVIADEPTSQLDGGSTSKVMDAIDVLAQRRTTVLVATHDRRVLERVDDVIALRDGAVATVTSGGTALSVIDRSGRLQLPPELRDRFKDRRVRIVWDDESDRVELERP
jgi:putative ABC transport system ATP-binding protein